MRRLLPFSGEGPWPRGICIELGLLVGLASMSCYFSDFVHRRFGAFWVRVCMEHRRVSVAHRFSLLQGGGGSSPLVSVRLYVVLFCSLSRVRRAVSSSRCVGLVGRGGVVFLWLQRPRGVFGDDRVRCWRSRCRRGTCAFHVLRVWAWSGGFLF